MGGISDEMGELDSYLEKKEDLYLVVSLKCVDASDHHVDCIFWWIFWHRSHYGAGANLMMSFCGHLVLHIEK